QIEPSPDIGIKWRSDYISGVVRREDGFVVLIDLPRLLSSTDTVSLASFPDVERAA
ncbi:MAG: chemotaxis protein CheW, partial [Brevundimonas sp.]|nr:chemotaxis protein CheW [Brevundimonas sp.]